MLRNNNHRTRDYLRTDRLVRRKRRKRTLRLIFSFILLIALLVGAFFVTRIDALSVATIRVEGNQEVSSDELINIAKMHASSSWLYMFPRQNIVLYPTSDIEADLRARYPRFSEVVVHRTGLNSIGIQVIERSPRALWCDADESCYAVDDQGYIYAPYSRGEDFGASTPELIRFTGGTQGTSSPVGTNLNSSSTFNDIALLLQGLKEMGLAPERVVIRNNNEFSVKVKPGGDVIFSDIRPLGDSLENLKAALQSAAFKSTSSPQTFDYIDTRFGNKIFFKIQK